MRAETALGFGEGVFPHSLPLSLLTHTGFIGLFIFAFVCYRASVNYIAYKKGYNINVSVFYFILLLYAAFFSFFTWPPIWFMLGMQCLKKKQ